MSRNPVIKKTPAASPPSGEPSPHPRRVYIGTAIARGVAMFIAIFSLLNLVIEIRQLGYNANLWWIDFRPLPNAFGKLILLWIAGLFIAFAVAPEMSDLRRRITRTTIELLALIIAWNVLNYYARLFRGSIHSVFPIPFSFFVAIALTGIWLGALSERPGRGPRAWLAMAAALLGCAVIFPLLQMICFGLTDYRRPADVAVVLGARVYKDGTPSDALADRVNTAVGLYKQNLVAKLIFSGGPGDGAINEAASMRTLAMESGVNPEDILIDPNGINTDATVRNVMPMLAKLTGDPQVPARVLVVSHFYHLPRIKIRFAEEAREVLTVPVREPLAHTPKFMAREVVALWKYYFDGLLK